MNSFVSFSDLSPSNSIGINKKGFIKRGVANIPVDASGCTSNNLSPIYTGNDNELSVLCKKLLKKDQVTKAKSISDILNVIKDRGSVVASELAPHFVYCYIRLSVMDAVDKIRFGMNQILLQLVLINKKCIRQFTASILPMWWLSMHDTSFDVANVARESFNAAVPEMKRRTVLCTHGANLFKLIVDILKSTPTTLAAEHGCSGANDGDDIERFNRVTVMCLASVGGVLSMVSLSGTNISPVEETNKSVWNAIRGIVSERGFWKRMDSSTMSGSQPMLRRAMYQLLNAICLHDECCLNSPNNENASYSILAGTLQLQQLCQMILNKRLFFAEPVDYYVEGAIECWISFVSRYRDAYWGPLTGPNSSMTSPAIAVLFSSLRDMIGRRPDSIVPYLGRVLASVPAHYISCGNPVDSKQIFDFILYLRGVTSGSERDGGEEVFSLSRRNLLLIDVFIAEICTVMFLRKGENRYTDENRMVVSVVEQLLLSLGLVIQTLSISNVASKVEEEAYAHICRILRRAFHTYSDDCGLEDQTSLYSLNEWHSLFWEPLASNCIFQIFQQSIYNENIGHGNVAASWCNGNGLNMHRHQVHYIINLLGATLCGSDSCDLLASILVNVAELAYAEAGSCFNMDAQKCVVELEALDGLSKIRGLEWFLLSVEVMYVSNSVDIRYVPFSLAHAMWETKNQCGVYAAAVLGILDDMFLVADTEFVSDDAEISKQVYFNRIVAAMRVFADVGHTLEADGDNEFEVSFAEHLVKTTVGGGYHVSTMVLLASDIYSLVSDGFWTGSYDPTQSWLEGLHTMAVNCLSGSDSLIAPSRKYSEDVIVQFFVYYSIKCSLCAVYEQEKLMIKLINTMLDSADSNLSGRNLWIVLSIFSSLLQLDRHKCMVDELMHCWGLSSAVNTSWGGSPGSSVEAIFAKMCIMRHIHATFFHDILSERTGKQFKYKKPTRSLKDSCYLGDSLVIRCGDSGVCSISPVHNWPGIVANIVTPLCYMRQSCAVDHVEQFVLNISANLNQAVSSQGSVETKQCIKPKKWAKLLYNLVDMIYSIQEAAPLYVDFPDHLKISLYIDLIVRNCGVSCQAAFWGEISIAFASIMDESANFSVVGKAIQEEYSFALLTLFHFTEYCQREGRRSEYAMHFLKGVPEGTCSVAINSILSSLLYCACTEEFEYKVCDSVEIKRIKQSAKVVNYLYPIFGWREQNMSNSDHLKFVAAFFAFLSAVSEASLNMTVGKDATDGQGELEPLWLQVWLLNQLLRDRVTSAATGEDIVLKCVELSLSPVSDGKFVSRVSNIFDLLKLLYSTSCVNDVDITSTVSDTFKTCLRILSPTPAERENCSTICTLHQSSFVSVSMKSPAVCREMSMLYLQKKYLSESVDDRFSSYSLKPVPCALVEIHVENPKAPYYTVRIENTKNEIQTEAHRIVFSDPVMGFDAIDTHLNANMVSTISTQTKDFRCMYFPSIVALLTSDPLADYCRLQAFSQAANLFCLMCQEVGANSSCDVLSQARGLALHLLGSFQKADVGVNNRSDEGNSYFSSISNTLKGLKLVQAILGAVANAKDCVVERSVLGKSGLWFTAIIHLLRESVAARKGTSKLLFLQSGTVDVKVIIMEELLTCVMIMENDLFKYNGTVRDLLLEVLVPVFVDQGNVAGSCAGKLNIDHILLRAISCLWTYKSYYVSAFFTECLSNGVLPPMDEATDGVVDDWEIIGLNLACKYYFSETAVGIPLDLLRMRLTACSTLHAALFSAQALFDSSLGSIKLTLALLVSNIKKRLLSISMQLLCAAWDGTDDCGTTRCVYSYSNVISYESKCMKLLLSSSDHLTAKVVAAKILEMMYSDENFITFCTIPSRNLPVVVGDTTGDIVTNRDSLQECVNKIQNQKIDEESVLGRNNEAGNADENDSIFGAFVGAGPAAALLDESFGLDIQLLVWLLCVKKLSTVNNIVAQFHLKTTSGSSPQRANIGLSEDEVFFLVTIRRCCLLFLHTSSTFERLVKVNILKASSQFPLNNSADHDAFHKEQKRVVDALYSACSGGFSTVESSWRNMCAVDNGGIDHQYVLSLLSLLPSSFCRSNNSALVGPAEAKFEHIRVYGLYASVVAFPAMFRHWWDEESICSGSLSGRTFGKKMKDVVQKFIVCHGSGGLFAREMALIAQVGAYQQEDFEKRISMKKEKLLKQMEQQVTDGEPGGGIAAPIPTLTPAMQAKIVEDEMKQEETLRILGRKSSCNSKGNVSYAGSGMEIIASYHRDESTIELKITLPSAYPLKNAEVDVSSKLGISENRWKRWKLQIIQLLTNNNFNHGSATHGTSAIGGGGGGSIIEAIQLWKYNIDKEFDGVEPCPICYSIVSAVDRKLPTLCCHTCHNKFHSTCLYQWFKSSGKSKCVICQQPFFE